jgi:trehalose 6-phosphate phosphatase
MEESGTISLKRDSAHDGCDTHGAQPPRFDLDTSALLLDVDGTILEIAPAPDLVHVPDSLVELLSRLNERTDGALALISGRTLHDLDELFAPLKLAAIGCHGAELRLRGEDEIIAAQQLDARLRERLGKLGALGDGIAIEDKVYAVALHYRRAPRLAKALLEATRATVAEIAAPGVHLIHGKHVIEVKAAGVNKGAAFRDLMRHRPFAGRHAVFLGDDVTDEAVFAALPEFGGYGISVGRTMAGAQFCFPRAADVCAWLASLADR